MGVFEKIETRADTQYQLETILTFDKIIQI